MSTEWVGLAGRLEKVPKHARELIYPVYHKLSITLWDITGKFIYRSIQ